MNRWSTFFRKIRLPGLSARLLLVALVAVHAIAIWGILAGRRDARLAAEQELSLQTLAHARSLEALLATLRGDCLFLSQSPPLLRLPASFASDDLMARRWARLEVEGTLLLFLEANPAVVRLIVRRGENEPIIVAGQRRETPLLLPPEQASPAVNERWLNGSWRIGASRQELWQLEAWVDPGALLPIAAPGLDDRLQVAWQPPVAVGQDQLVAKVQISDPHWQARADCWLVRSEDSGRLIASMETLARRYRKTVILQLAVAALASVLGVIAFRQARRAAHLEADNRHQVELRELEQQLMHSERLASVGRLAAGMAHEINNPLEGMSNYLALIEEDVEQERTDDLPELLTRLREGLERIAGITRRALHLADPGHDDKVEVDLVECLHQTVDFLASDLASRNIECRWQGSEAAPKVRGQPITLGQLFLNLILNACQHQEPGGVVELTVKTQGREAVVTIADRGPGLSAEALERLFEPFYSTRGSTGLGLAICRGIISDHGGTITGRNRPRGGAIFEVRLPLNNGEEDVKVMAR